METLKIVASLVPAVKSDIFTESGDFKAAAVLFCKSEFSGTYSGPRFVDHHFPDELVILRHKDFFYVLKAGNAEYSSEFTFKLILREAVGDDFKWNAKEAKYYRPYYLKVAAGGVTGPHQLLASTDMQELAVAIKEKRVFVPHEKQTFVPYQTKKLAS